MIGYVGPAAADTKMTPPPGPAPTLARRRDEIAARLASARETIALWTAEPAPWRTEGLADGDVFLEIDEATADAEAAHVWDGWYHVATGGTGGPTGAGLQALAVLRDSLGPHRQRAEETVAHRTALRGSDRARGRLTHELLGGWEDHVRDARQERDRIDGLLWGIGAFLDLFTLYGVCGRWADLTGEFSTSPAGRAGGPEGVSQTAHDHVLRIAGALYRREASGGDPFALNKEFEEWAAAVVHRTPSAVRAALNAVGIIDPDDDGECGVGGSGLQTRLEKLRKYLEDWG